MMFIFKIVVVLTILALGSIRVYRSLSPVQLAWVQRNPRFVVYPIATLAAVLVLWLSWEGLTSFLLAPSLDTVWTFTKDHWLWILLFGGALYLLTSLFPKGKEGLAKILCSAVVVIMFTLFIGLPMIGLVRGAFLPTVNCLDASAGGTRNCVLNASWSAPLKAATEPDVVGKSLCFTPESGVEFERFVNSGGSFWRFRAKEGEILLKYRLMGTCPSDPSSVLPS